MTKFSMWTRTSLLLSVALWAGRCAESPDAPGTADATANDDVDGGNDTQPDVGADTAAPIDVDSGVDVNTGLDVDSGTDVDSGLEDDSGVDVDSGVDGTTEDAALDGAGDALDAGDPSDVADVSPDAGAELGTPCVTDGECASGECVDVAGGGVAGLCSDVCVEADECAEGFDCTLVTLEGAAAEGRCLPVDYCADGDEDGFGVGSGCRGVDCNDDDFMVNTDAIDVCDGVDNDCDGIADDNIAGLTEGCSTGSEGVCAPGRTQCVGGEVRCIAFASPVAEVCDGLDNDCDGSADEGVLLEGYRVVDGVCVPVTCGSVPAAPANAALVSVSSTQFGGEVEYGCNPGYGTAGSSPVDGRVTRVCGASGDWEPAIGTCTPVDCGSAPAASANATLVSVDRTTLGGSAAYACNEGYRVSASASGRYEVVCEASGLWSASGTCDPVSCGGLTPPANGTVATPDGTEYTNVGVYSCNSGYVLTSGSSSRICDATGSWSGSAAVCTPVDCGALSDPENGDVVVAAGTSLGATASYTCLEGYALSGSATRTCDVTGAWSGSAPSCAPTSCGAVATVANATASVPSALFGSTATFTCDVGFVQRAGTSNTQTCTGAAWVWSGTVLSCDPVSCGPLGNPANGTVATPDGIAYADVATYACNSGFALTGSANRTCELSGLWSGAAPGCAPVDCGAPPTTTNGTRTFASTTYTSVASYACAEGYTLTGSASSTCTATGTWTTAPTCVAVSCGALGGPANGSVSTPTGVEYTDVATYACVVGYQVNGAATRTCLASGLWSGVAPSCAPVNCGALGRPTNGIVSTPGGTTLGATATYSCDSGYVLTSGSSSRTCSASGSWSGSAAVCTPVDCGTPPTVTNGTRTFTTTTFDSDASYTCNGGYTRSGLARIICSETGSWGTAPTCVDTNECATAGSVCTRAGNACTNTTGSWQCSCAAGYTGTTVTGGNATCVPVNDTPAGAITINMAVASSTLTVDTSAAVNNTTGPCGCTGLSGRDVFYNFTIPAGAPEIIYADTLGSAFDTSLFVQTSAGVNVIAATLANGLACNDDNGLSGCDTLGQSQIMLQLNPGTYRLVLSGCEAGAATIHFQHLPVGNGPIAALAAGTTIPTGTTAGTGRVVAEACDGGNSPENTYYWYTCQAATGGAFSASTCGRATWDTVLEQRSALRGANICNDDNTGGCGRQSTVTSTIPAGAGIHTLYVDGYTNAFIGSSGAYSVVITRP